MATDQPNEEYEAPPPLPGVKWLAVTQSECEQMVDRLGVTSPETRSLALKAMALCLEFESDPAIAAVELAVSKG